MKNRKTILVSDVMTRTPITISPDTNLLECARKMVKNKIGNLLITDKKRLIGFISENDILWALIKKSKNDLSQIRAIDISPKKIAVIKPDNTIKEAIDKMKSLKFERLPVIDNNELVGMLTAKDILSFNPEFYPEFEEFAKIREESDKLRRIKKAKELHEGICEECGNHDLLYHEDGRVICESCRRSM